MKKTSFLESMIFLMLLASLSIGSVMAGITREEEGRDPTTGYSSPPGESFSWAYQFGVYNPETQRYTNIMQDHDYGWNGTGTYDPHTPDSKDPYHPWVQTYVEYWYQGSWMLDTSVTIAW